MFKKFIESVLVVAVSFALQAALKALGVPLDAGTFNALVAAIVSALLALGGSEYAQKRGLL